MFATALAAAATEIGACFDEVLADFPPGPITDGMRYATDGGKRLRGFLVLESARLHGIGVAQARVAATAVEALHAYSLVHDDLPCMDDDDLRRGQPTVHRKWDEGTAVLVGDALQTLAFALLAGLDTAPEVRVDLIAALAAASGASGMVLGQAQDMTAPTATAPLSLEGITALQMNKTGALIRWSGEAGARLAQADPAPLTAYSTALGLAFQIADDILDVEGDASLAGKRLQKDAGAGKATFVGHLGLDGARARAAALVAEAEAALDVYGTEAETLRAAARFVISRKN